MTIVLDDEPFLDDERQRAGLRIEVDVLDVRGHLAAVADALVVVVDLEHVLTERVGVEDLAHREVHQGQERVARDLRVAGEEDLGEDGVLDHAIGDRNAVGPLAYQRRSDVGEVAERVDAGEVFLNDLGIVGLSRPRRDDRHDRLRRHVQIAGDVDGHDFRGRGRECRSDAQRDREDREQQTQVTSQCARSPRGIMNHMKKSRPRIGQDVLTPSARPALANPSRPTRHALFRPAYPVSWRVPEA